MVEKVRKGGKLGGGVFIEEGIWKLLGRQVKSERKEQEEKRVRRFVDNVNRNWAPRSSEVAKTTLAFFSTCSPSKTTPTTTPRLLVGPIIISFRDGEFDSFKSQIFQLLTRLYVN